MGKSKADYQKEAKAAGVEFTSETTIAQLQVAIQKAGKPASKSEQKRVDVQKGKLSEPEQTLKDRAARREADAEEKALADKNRAADQAAAAAKVRTAAQQAADRAEGTE